MKNYIDKIKKKQSLTFDESKAAFEILMEGKANDQEIFDFLTSLSEKGESSDEIAGGVFVLRNKSKRVTVEGCVDTCGTGGDGMNTLNISTASALLLASMGIKVAKHGNKAVSSKCGSGDVLEALNIKINLEPNDIEDQIKKNNFGFMFAPNYHSAMRFVGPIRKKIGKRTIFNMIGPLSSPALVKRQVVGVFDKKLLKIFANALNNLDIKFAWIVNSEDGLDEISPYAKTNVIQLKDNKISEIIIDPKELNVNADKFENLVGDDAKFNAGKMINIFEGEDTLSKFDDAYMIEMYFENTDGFAGDKEIMNQFGLENREEATFVVSQRRFEDMIAPDDNIGTRPKEGDLIYFPLVSKVFEISFVDHDEPFYQIGNLPVYKLSVRTFEYSSEDLDTGIKEIDAIETAYTLDALGFQLALEQTTTFNQGISLEDNSGLVGLFEAGSVSSYPGSSSSDTIIGENEELNGAIIAENLADSGEPVYIIQEEYVVGDMSRDKTAQNELFDVLDDTILDFTESNPFGDAGTKG